MAARIIGLNEMGRLNPIANRPMLWATRKTLRLLQNRYGGVHVKVEGFSAPSEPVLFAMNHTHYFDFTQSRLTLLRRFGIKTTSFAKVRAFQNPIDGGYMKRLGNIPLASRGYLISADFAQLHGQTITEEQYQIVRAHVDHGHALPNEPVYHALQYTTRDMLDRPFSPNDSRYRVAILARYAEAMRTTLGHAKTVIQAGHCLHIYPEGLYSTRLSQGRIGAVQFAAALDLPIVPVGFSGMNQLFKKRQPLPYRSGELTMRFGTPYRLNREELRDFTPFMPSEEARLNGVLREETDKLMEKINGLLEPECTWGDPEGDGLKGVSRFFE